MMHSPSPPKTIADFVSGRDNNFNLLRLVAAMMVIFSHCWPLRFGGPSAEPTPILDYRFFSLPLHYSLGFMGVQIFFIVSGFLVTQSFCRSPNPLRFLGARAFRIMPGLLVANLFCVFVVGAWFTTKDWPDYFASQGVSNYLLHNTGMDLTIYGLPGVFKTHVFPHVVNGCLWSLPHEVLCYILVLVFGVFGLYRSALTGLLFLTATAAFSYHAATGWEMIYTEFFRATAIIPTFMRYLWLSFAIGQTLFIARRWIPLNGWTFAAGVLLAVLSAKLGWLSFLYPLFFAYAVLALAFLPAGRIRAFNKLPDISYGLYLYGFPITQSILGFFPHLPIAPLFAAVLAITAGLAWLSFRFIEHPAQRCFQWIERHPVWEGGLPAASASVSPGGHP